jgi:para-aminobenzoate synthetase/4-amino-4-deoxychorismate lyase
MTPHHPLPDALLALAAAYPNSVLLHTARPDAENHLSHLFLHPTRILATHSPNELPSLFDQLQSALAEGLYAAGFLSYEAGYSLQNIPYDAPITTPLAWFGLYTAPITFDHRTNTLTPRELPTTPPTPHHHAPAFTAADIALTTPPSLYREKILAIKEHIAAGATYQVNLTDRIHLPARTSPAELYATLAHQQPVAYSAFLHLSTPTSAQHILSLSPELFFRTIPTGHPEGLTRRITTRPMKGTWPRGLDAAEDALAALHLQHDDKNRAEHLMIVDLLRNDLGRLCTPGSIHVDSLFAIERYPTLLQMISTISGTLPASTSWYHIFRSLFPSGSITGAPKISTMRIIHDLEPTPRGIYTGAIGFIAPSGHAAFNVAIRTLYLHQNTLTMGVGGGIVIDSDPATEYAECLLKASFLTRSQPHHELLETLLWDGAFFLLDLHLDRLQLSCDYFDFPFDPTLIRDRLHQLAGTFAHLQRHRVRLTLNRLGHITLTSTLLPDILPKSSQPCRVILAAGRTSSTDLFFRHKTTHRPLYDRLFSAAQSQGFDDVLFLNERNELTEGAINNLFLRIDGQLYTPPITSGALPGVFRRHLLDALPSAHERVLTLNDLHTATDIFLCNSVRGLRRITHFDPSITLTA